MLVHFCLFFIFHLLFTIYLLVVMCILIVIEKKSDLIFSAVMLGGLGYHNASDVK